MSIPIQRGVVSDTKQRAGAEGTVALSRRAVLGALAGTVGVAGCSTLGTEGVSLLAAGSLAGTVEEFVGPAFEEGTGITVRGEYHGSNAVMRMVEDRTAAPDVVVSADATLLRDRLYGERTDWDVEFASNSIGLGYRRGTAFADRLEGGTPWYDVVREVGPGSVGISDPDLDPLGYRAVQAFELAGRRHGLEGFRETLLSRVYVEPSEPQLLAGVESGARPAAVVYRNMALDRGVGFLEFPPAYSFGDPALADHYATVEYTTEEGYTARGRPVVYNATVSDDADNPDRGRQFVQFLLDRPALLEEAGLTVESPLPRPVGAVPAEVEP
jgi:ABC-type molybdate transport system, periplasmic component